MLVCVLIASAVLISVALLFRYGRIFFEGPQFGRDDLRMDGKVVIVTGANTGIGKETALDLAQRGATVYMACRDMKKCEDARLEIIHRTNNKNVYNRHLDLASLDSVRKFAREFLAEEDQLNVLINNAGVMMCPKLLTHEGFEMQVGTNHLGHFLLTNLLLDLLKKSAPSRIINVSSWSHTFIKRIDRENYNSEKFYNEGIAYFQSKLSNVLFSRELSKRLEGTGVTVNSLHPGVIVTELFRHFHPALLFVLKPFAPYFLKSSKSGAQTQIRLAVDPELCTVTGKYFSDCKEVKESEGAQNDDDALWLWNESVKLTDLEISLKNNREIFGA